MRPSRRDHHLWGVKYVGELSPNLYVFIGFHEMTISDLKADIDAGADIFILDVRLLFYTAPFLYLRILHVPLQAVVLALHSTRGIPFAGWHRDSRLSFPYGGFTFQPYTFTS